MTRPLSSSERQRLRTTGNLWRALIPLVLIVGGLVVLTWPRSEGTGSNDGVHVVDLAGPIAAARAQAGFTVLAPTGLGPDWRPTSVEFMPGSGSSAAGGVTSGASGGTGGGTGGTISAAALRIGYVTPSNTYAELYESNDAADAVSAQYGPLTTDGSATVAGASWDRYRTPKGRELLRHTAGGVTVVVTGSASSAELVTLAGSLR